MTAEALYIQNEVRFASKYVVFQSFFHRILNDLTKDLLKNVKKPTPVGLNKLFSRTATVTF